jgi:hypothetical protein
MSGVTITASGAGSSSTTTDSSGAYRMSNLGGGAYTMTPSKTGDVSGISSFDAALVAQHAAGITTLSECQQAAGDASNNGSLSSFDASFIAQYAAGIANAANIAGSWKFLPANRTYASLSGEQTGQNFSGTLVGDVSGNWSPSGAGFTAADKSSRYASAFIEQQSNISLPQLAATPGATLIVPVTVSNLSEQGIIAYDLDIVFDQNVLQLQNRSYDASGTISAGMTITANATPGRLRLSAFGANALTGMGALLNLKFTVTGAISGNTTLTW